MAITDLGLLGTGSSKAAATTLAVTNTTGAIIPAGTLVHIAGCWDNIASVTAPTITCSTVGGATATVNHATAIGSGVTTTAGAGIWHSCVRALTTADIAIGGTIATLTSNQSAVARAAHAEGWSGVTATLRGTVTTATSTTGSPSVATTGTALVTGDLVIGSVSFENNAQMTADADTLNGTWDAIVGTFTTGSTAATNVGTGTQDKVVTATGVQTYNPTGGVADTVACVYSLVPLPNPAISQGSYRFYADGTESGLSDGYDETNVSVLSSFSSTPGADHAQSFLGDGRKLTRARFWLGKLAAPTGNITVRLYAHTGTFGVDGTGTGSVLATATSRLRSSLQTTAQWEYFDFDGTFTLAAGTPYVLSLAIDDVSNGTNYGVDSTTPTHAGNQSSRTTGAWFSTPTSDVIFGVYTDNALAAQDTAYTADVTAGDVNLQLRTRLQSTNTGLLPATDDYQLQWERNASGTWTNVSTGIVDTYTGPVNSSLGFGDNTTAANGQSFLGTGQTLSAAKFMLRKLGSPTFTFTALLYTHTGTFGAGDGVPLVSVAASTTVLNAASLSTTASWVTFAFDNTYVLAAGTPYFIVVAVSAGVGDASNYVQPMTNSAGTHAGGLSFQTASTGLWTALSGSDALFEVDTVAVAVVPYDSPSLTDAAATTNRLGAGTGSFVAGKVSEDGLVDDLGWTANSFTEVLYALKLWNPALANADTLRFRVLRNGVTTGLTYTSTPTINVTKTAPGSGITYVNGTNTAYATHTNTVVTNPTGTVDGDFIIVAVVVGLATASTMGTPPAGWTTIGTATSVTAGGFNVKHQLFTKVASGEGASWTWTHASQSSAAIALAYRGVDTTTPLDATPVSATGAAGPTTTWPSITTLTDNAWVVGFEQDWGDTANNLTASAGFTERIEGLLVYSEDKIKTPAGASGTFTHTNNSAVNDPWSAWTVALRPASGVAAQPPRNIHLPNPAILASFIR